MEFEQVNKAADPEAMRKEIYALRRNDPLCANVMNMADFNGLSGEDRYTILAYHALAQLQRLKQDRLDELRISPRHAVFLKD